MSNIDDGLTPEYVPEQIEVVSEPVEIVEEATYVTEGRVDPTYEPAVHQYNAPVAETRSFGSRFWWLLPLLAVLIAIPFILRSCNRAEACDTLPPAVWTTALQDQTWATVSAFDTAAFNAEHRDSVLTDLAFLCNRRLSGATLHANDITNQLSGFTLADGVATNILNVVNGSTFCRCS